MGEGEAGSSTGGRQEPGEVLCPECGGRLEPVGAPAAADRWAGHGVDCEWRGLGPEEIKARMIDRPAGPPDPPWLELQRSVTRLCTAGAVLLEELVRVGAPLLDQLVQETIEQEERLRQAREARGGR